MDAQCYIDAERACKKIKQEKCRYGEYKKICLHIHTPASYDYKLRSEWSVKDYKEATEDSIFCICLEQKVFPKDYSITDIPSQDTKSVFSSKKELMAYLLLANSLIKNSIEMAVVTDHDTIDGVEKLRKAVDILKKYKTGSYPEILLGIEISCADKNHVVGIFDDSQLIRGKINSWLEDNLISQEDGTIKSSLDTLDFIDEIGGIGYLAHINSSDMLQKGHMSGGYKKKVLCQSKIMGISDLELIHKTTQQIHSYSKITPKYLLDNDAHSIEELNNKAFWVKSSKCSFAALKEAINDYDIAINLREDDTPSIYMMGIYIEQREEGFLGGKDNQALCLRFAPSLNCFIGGRGTGKSSILELMEYALNQHCSSASELKFLCSHGNTWILYKYYDKEYLVELRTARPAPGYDILTCFEQNERQGYYYKYYFNERKIHDITLSKYVSVYEVINGTNNLRKVSNKNDILRKLFDTKYSINELVNTAGSDKINNFVFDTLFKNRTLSRPEDCIRAKSISGLKKVLGDIPSVLKTREQEVLSVISPFNDTQERILQIKYRQEKINKEPPLYKWLFNNLRPDSWHQKKNIKRDNIAQYFLVLYEKLGIWEFFKMMVNADVEKATQTAKLLDFRSEYSPSLVEKGITELKPNESDAMLENLMSKIIAPDNISSIIEFIKSYIKEMETFSLLFNVNNKEGIQLPVLFKPVQELSLGQKVVAMLSFILGYSEYSSDFRPLIIDQPEDNLDNQYIYRNLVCQLRSIKEKRQIIIATHSATIVTNAKADQVCVMNSNGQHGWVEAIGYPVEKRIKSHILNHLEGGTESFLHKMSIYEPILKQNN